MLESPCVTLTFIPRSKLLRLLILPVLMFGRTTSKALYSIYSIYWVAGSHMIRCSNVTFLDELNQVCRADGMTYVIVWDNVRFHHAQMVQAWFQAHPQFTTHLPPCAYPQTLLSLTRLRNFSPHGDGRYMIGALTNKPPFSRPWMVHAMTSRQTSVRPGFAIPEDSSQDVC